MVYSTSLISLPSSLFTSTVEGSGSLVLNRGDSNDGSEPDAARAPRPTMYIVDTVLDRGEGWTGV